MVYLEKRKRKNGAVYVYLCRKERVAGEVKRTLNFYLGREDSITKAQLTTPEVSEIRIQGTGQIPLRGVLPQSDQGKHPDVRNSLGEKRDLSVLRKNKNYSNGDTIIL